LIKAMNVVSMALEPINAGGLPATQGHGIELLAQQIFDQLSGVTFRQSTPAGREHPQPPPSQTPDIVAAAPVPRTASRVLVIEDDEVEQVKIEGMLKASILHIDVRTQGSGAGALDELARFRPDLVVLDLHLPDMPGLQLLALMKAAWPRLPVLVYSGDEQAISRLNREERTPSEQTVAVLPKDVEPDVFIRLVPTLFKRRHRDVIHTSRVLAAG
jgi:CheY-like chemotaxis protein